MKLVTLLAADRTEHVGIVIEQDGKKRIIDLAAVHDSKTYTLPSTVRPYALTDMVEFIKEQNVTVSWANEVAANASSIPISCQIDEKEAVLLAPIPHPVSCRDGYAFRQHVEAARRGRGVEMIPEFDHFPVFYFTNHLAITGPGEIFVMEKALERLDFELEVAIVVGKEGRNISAEKADEYIFGYMIMNDWSARALQAEEMKMNLGPAKGKDFATSLGPYLLTKDELTDKIIKGAKGERYDLKMKAFHNGKQVSEGNLKDMNWSFAQILERVSYGVTIHPGEVIGSGTVGTGCYMELNLTSLKENPVWIKPNDTFTLEVEKLGRLDNTIRKANA